MGTLRLGIAALFASVLAVACGSSQPPPPSTPTTTSTAETKKEPEKKPDDGASKAAALDALTSGEAKKNACDADHQAALEKLRAELDAAMQAKTGEDGKPLGLQPVFNRVVPLSENARAMEVAVKGRGTEVHVLAYSAKDVSIDVLAGGAAATTMRSPFQRASTAQPPSIELAKTGKVELQSDSRQIQMKPGQPLQVKMSGQGCAVLVGYLKP
jgi:hypothetical protein